MSGVGIAGVIDHALGPAPSHVYSAVATPSPNPTDLQD